MSERVRVRATWRRQVPEVSGALAASDGRDGLSLGQHGAGDRPSGLDLGGSCSRDDPPVQRPPACTVRVRVSAGSRRAGTPANAGTAARRSGAGFQVAISSGVPEGSDATRAAQWFECWLSGSRRMTGSVRVVLPGRCEGRGVDRLVGPTGLVAGRVRWFERGRCTHVGRSSPGLAGSVGGCGASSAAGPIRGSRHRSRCRCRLRYS